MEQRFGYCDSCKNKGMCYRCYRGSYYEFDHSGEEERTGQYGTY